MSHAVGMLRSMASYSHSGLEKFRKCPLAYRYSHLDPPDAPPLANTIEQHAGKCVHAALEWLHKRVDEGAAPILGEVEERFRDAFDGGWDESIRIVVPDRGREAMRATGARCVRNYYEINGPFDRGTLVATEWSFKVPLIEGATAPVLSGRADRISRHGRARLEIHDYKTGSHVPSREEIERSEQPAIYAMAVMHEMPESCAEGLECVWHYLRKGIVVSFGMDAARVERARSLIAGQIANIEAASEWPARPSRLCPWCEWSHVCPESGYRKEIRDASSSCAVDPGPGMVDRLERLARLHREFMGAYRKERGEIEKALRKHAASRGASTVPGSRVEAVLGNGSTDPVRLRRGAGSGKQGRKR